MPGQEPSAEKLWQRSFIIAASMKTQDLDRWASATFLPSNFERREVFDLAASINFSIG